MSDLVQRLATGSHRLVYSSPRGAADLKQAIDRGYVLLEFTETRGGSALGFRVETGACDLRDADFEAARGKVHIEGHLTLDDVPVRLVADVALDTLEGHGQLHVLG